MDDQTEAPASPDTSSRAYLRLFGPPLSILVVGLIITAVAEHTTATIAWAYGALISGFAAIVCALVASNWHRQVKVSTATLRDLQSQSQQLSNIQTEKRILRKALDESEQRTRDLVSLSGGIVCELDEQGKTGYVSSGAAAVLGYTPADLADIELRSLISENDREAFDKTLQTARQARQLQSAELNLLNAEQQPVPVILRVLVLHDPLHGFSGFRLSMQPRHRLQ